MSSSPVRFRFLCVFALGLAIGAMAPVASAAPSADCFEQLEKGRGPEIACTYPTQLTDEERADLRRLTREMLQDVRCFVDIRIERSLLEEALTAADHEFVAPPQPVRCELATRDGATTITASFAPRVVFTAGLAVEASPGLADVVGVPKVLSWPVVQYVNRARSIREGMLAVINAYRSHHLRTGLASSR